MLEARYVLLPAAAALLVLDLGCTGSIQVGNPSVEMARIELVQDTLGGLQVADCVERLGADSCPVLPNDFECDRLELSVRGDASVVGTCKTVVAGAVQARTVRAGVPISCRLDRELGCVQCRDTADRAVLDTCSVQVSLYTGKLPRDLPSGSGILVGPEADGNDGKSACSPDRASDLLEKRLNAILRSEGLSFSFVAPRGSGTTGSKFKAQMCTKDKSIKNMLKRGCEGQAKQEGFCYCWTPKKTSRPACRVNRMLARAVSEACAAVPDGCDKQWNGRLWSDRAAAARWLMRGSYGTKGWMGTGGGGTPPTGDAGKPSSRKGFNSISGPGGIIAKGSPLVLDLAGDGIRLTSAAGGVRFDLLGVGQLRTAWIAGADDALLALDRDGDGRITTGAELFGQASTLGGQLAADGFQALARLDQPALGGNRNGLVERGDLLFDQLLLWTDANRDGVSQPDELRPLEAAGITALQLHARPCNEVDAHGNELALRGRFLRTDGSDGALVDVFLVLSARSKPASAAAQ